MLILLLLLWWVGERRSRAARFNVMGHKNEPQYVRLKSQYDLNPETILKLPIDVPTEQLGLYGPLPPRLVNITSSNPSSIYGTGDVVKIKLTYTVPVLVAGAPTLTLNTGCLSSSCTIAEVQTFKCGAESGFFAIRLENQYIMNINVNTTQDTLKARLEELDGVYNVSVSYGQEEDRTAYQDARRVCSRAGTSVNITFNRVSFTQYNGNCLLYTSDAADE